MEKDKVQYDFESYFADSADTVLHVDCNTVDEKNWYSVLIDAYDDPYKLYYEGKRPDNEEEFRSILFCYLKKKYPEYF